MCINLPLKVVPNKCAISSFFYIILLETTVTSCLGNFWAIFLFFYFIFSFFSGNQWA